jgi:hypothetical protein
MFELRYLPVQNNCDNTPHPKPVIINDRETVEFTALGPLIKLTQKTWLLIPWARVTGLTSGKSDLLEIASLQQK